MLALTHVKCVDKDYCIVLLRCIISLHLSVALCYSDNRPLRKLRGRPTLRYAARLWVVLRFARARYAAPWLRTQANSVPTKTAPCWPPLNAIKRLWFAVRTKKPR